MMNDPNGNGHGAQRPSDLLEIRWIELDLSDLTLPAEMPTLDLLAAAAAHVYERFVPYADEGWEWMTHPGSRSFDGWTHETRDNRRVIVSARLLCRRIAPDEPTSGARPAHGLSAYRTRQLTGRPWTAEPGSKIWRPFSRAVDQE